MKLNILKFIGFFVLVAFFASCEQEAFEEYSSVPADAAPTLSVTIDSNTDSAMVVSYSINVPGRVTLAVVPATVDTPTIAEIELRSIDGSVTVDYFKHDNEAGSGTVTYEDLLPYTQYRVMAIAHNTDGVASDLFITDFIRTQDFANPVINGFTPGKADTDIDPEVMLGIEFSEPVTYVAGKSIHIGSAFYGYSETIVADSIVYDGNMVYFKHSKFPYSDYIFINVEEGAFVDVSGNIAPEVYTVNGVQLDWYFKTWMDPLQNLEIIFEKFLGSYACTDYSNSDSTSVDWGPYSVTITEDEDVEYGVIIDNFWAWGIQAKFQFHKDGTITCPEQVLDGIDLGDIYDGFDEDIYVRGWAPDLYTTAVGYWDYTDYSFDIALSFYTAEYGQIYDDIYQSYVVVTEEKNLSEQKTQMNRIRTF